MLDAQRVAQAGMTTVVPVASIPSALFLSTKLIKLHVCHCKDRNSYPVDLSFAFFPGFIVGLLPIIF